MRNDKNKKEIEQVEEAVRICKLNIENQKRKLEQIYIRLNSIEEILNIKKSISTREIDNLTDTYTKLKVLKNRQKSLVQEFENELKTAEDKLLNIKTTIE